MQVLWDGFWGNGAAGNLWKVPENDGSNNMKIKVKEEMGDKLGQREASVLRYKEKRRSRLFSKRIRYEVRKLNAEKRPRMKVRLIYSTGNVIHASIFSYLVYIFLEISYG